MRVVKALSENVLHDTGGGSAANLVFFENYIYFFAQLNVGSVLSLHRCIYKVCLPDGSGYWRLVFFFLLEETFVQQEHTEQSAEYEHCHAYFFEIGLDHFLWDEISDQCQYYVPHSCADNGV